MINVAGELIDKDHRSVSKSSGAISVSEFKREGDLRGKNDEERVNEEKKQKKRQQI